MSGFELRPLSLGELLDRAFLLYRRNFWLFAGIMVIPSCLIMPMRFLNLRRRDVPFPWSRTQPQPHAFGFALSYLLVYWIIYAVAEAATTNAVADEYLGRHSTIREAYGKISGRFWRAIGVTLSVYIRTFVIIIFCAGLGGAGGIAFTAALKLGNVMSAPALAVVTAALAVAGFALGLFLSARYTLSLPAVLLEDINGRAAIRRSVQLSHGRRGQIFVALLLGVVVSYAAAAVLQGPIYMGIWVMGIKGHLPNGVIFGLSVSGALGAAIASPLVMIALVLCYYDLRIRKEGFDLQQMMASLPEANPAAPASLA